MKTAAMLSHWCTQVGDTAPQQDSQAWARLSDNAAVWNQVQHHGKLRVGEEQAHMYEPTGWLQNSM